MNLIFTKHILFFLFLLQITSSKSMIKNEVVPDSNFKMCLGTLHNKTAKDVTIYDALDKNYAGMAWPPNYYHAGPSVKEIVTIPANKQIILNYCMELTRECGRLPGELRKILYLRHTNSQSNSHLSLDLKHFEDWKKLFVTLIIFENGHVHIMPNGTHIVGEVVNLNELRTNTVSLDLAFEGETLELSTMNLNS